MRKLLSHIFHSLSTGDTGFSLKKELAAIVTITGLVGAMWIIYEHPEHSEMVLLTLFGYASTLLGLGAWQSNVKAKLDTPATSSKTTDGDKTSEVTVSP